ncbi:MAG: hypothetical protein ACOC93_03850 [Planctomycetota bacterium]
MPRANDRAESDPFAAAGSLAVDAPILQQLRRLLADADAEIERIRPRCWGGGACCKFDLFAHRLYASTAELGLLASRPPVDLSRAKRRRCPYQRGPACTARSARPLGCRTFFCAAEGEERLQEIHERYHQRIRHLHGQSALPYIYADITRALPEIHAARQARELAPVLR